MLGLEEYKKRVATYTEDDYYGPCSDSKLDIYKELAEAAGYRTEKFKQYAEVVLRPAAIEKGISEISFDLMLEYARRDVVETNGQPSILSVIDDIENKAKTDGSATLLPLLCGSGKSTAITKKIIEALGGRIKTNIKIIELEKNRNIYALNSIMRQRSDLTRRFEHMDLPEGYKPDQHIKLIVEELVAEESIELLNSKLEEIYNDIPGYNDAIAKRNTEYHEYRKQHGLLVVTDNLGRMKEYWNPKKAKDDTRYTEFEKEFIAEHKDDVVIWDTKNTGDNQSTTTREFVKRAKKAPVVIMTTQRFFDYIKEEDLITLIRGGEYKKSLIIFDETPYLAGIRDIDATTLNKIDSGLSLTLNDSIDQDDRYWCLDQWESFQSRIIKVLRRLEQDSSEDKKPSCYYEDGFKQITEDDEKFFRIIEENKDQFKKTDDYKDTYRLLQDVLTLINDWGMYSFRSGKEVREDYTSKFSIYYDNKSIFEKLGIKIIILDGSGDISPMYSNLDYITKESGENFDRDLSALTIKLVNITINEEALRNKGTAIANAVMNHLLSDEKKISDTVVFTRKSAEYLFKGKGYKKTAHFGDIKGRNDFNGETLFAQVGVSRNPPSYYDTWFTARYHELAEIKKSYDAGNVIRPDKAIEIIETRRHIENMFILADIEQNIFRSAIRNVYNAKPVTYYIFFNTALDRNQDLAKEIHKRYGSMGATVIDCHLMQEDHEAAQPMSNVEKVIDFLNNRWDGKLTKAKELYAMITEYCGVSQATVRKLRSGNRKVGDMFKELEANAERKSERRKGYYCK